MVGRVAEQQEVVGTTDLGKPGTKTQAVDIGQVKVEGTRQLQQEVVGKRQVVGTRQQQQVVVVGMLQQLEVHTAGKPQVAEAGTEPLGS